MEKLDRTGTSHAANTVPGRPANAGRRRGMSRAALGKVKMGAIAVSIVAFFGSLVAVAQASPAAIARMNNSTGPASVTQNAPVAANPFLGNRSQSNSIAPLNLPQRPQMRSIRPMVRSRGS